MAHPNMVLPSLDDIDLNALKVWSYFMLRSSADYQEFTFINYVVWHTSCWKADDTSYRYTEIFSYLEHNAEV